MGTQISLKLSEKVFSIARSYAEKHGFDTLQDFIREVLREKLFEQEDFLGGKYTALASESSLAKNWMTKEEDQAWGHLQKPM